LLKRQCKRELAAQRVAIGANVTQDREALMIAQNLANFIKC
jgi:hypothetical protein